MKRTVISLLLTLTILLSLSISVVADEYDDYSESDIKAAAVYDWADRLSDSEEKQLLKEYERIARHYEFGVSLVIAKEENISEIEEYAATLYWTGGHGYGHTDDGCLLVINEDSREWAFYADGNGLDVFTDDGIAYIGEKLTKYLSDDRYYDASMRYAELCEVFLKQAQTGKPYDGSNMPIDMETIGIYILISLGVGLLIALITVSVMKGQLKSVRRQAAAHHYLKEGSFMLTDSRDIYLYRTVSRVPRPKQTSSGGSSSGRSGGGGRSGSGSF